MHTLGVLLPTGVITVERIVIAGERHGTCDIAMVAMKHLLTATLRQSDQAALLIPHPMGITVSAIMAMRLLGGHA